jgi:ABC-type transport system involved in cytochrome c biogenesis permease subunit
MIDLFVAVSCLNSAGGCGVGIGVDSTTVPSGFFGFGNVSSVFMISGSYQGRDAVGYHAYNWLEFSQSAATTFYGFMAGQRKSGMSGRCWC